MAKKKTSIKAAAKKPKKKVKTATAPKKIGQDILDKKKKELLKAKAIYHKHAREFIVLWSKVKRAQREAANI